MSEKMDQVFQITQAIADEYIEEAAKKPQRPAWMRMTALAAIFAIVIMATLLLLPSGKNDPVPFFAIRAYAADGSVKILDTVGQKLELKTGGSELFPYNTVYVLDISLDYYDGDFSDLDIENLRIFHNDYAYAPSLQPGETDHNLYVQWLTEEKDGMNGIRLIGWCEEKDLISFALRDLYGRVICEKKIWITWKETFWGQRYEARLERSFQYREDMSTDALIRETLQQDYSLDFIVLSTIPLHCDFLRDECGFPALMNRPDAASKMLELYEEFVNGKEVFSTESVVFGVYDTACLLGEVLHWEEFQNQMTIKEKFHLEELYAKYQQDIVANRE